MTRILAVLMCVALSACAPKFNAHTADKVVVSYDEGGIIDYYQTKLDAINTAGKRVEIKGVCMSACTMYLGADDACVWPSARLAFHGSLVVPGSPLSKAEWDAKMSKHYPPALREWFHKEADHLVIVWKTLTGSEVIALGANAC